jgi:hypothetical protein
MNREEPKDRPLVSSAVNILKSRMSWLGATVVALISGATALVTNVENLKSHAQAYIEERTFFAGLQHPYPALLKKEDIEQWSSGRAQLAIFQIEGYRGKLKESPTWIKLCLTSSLIFPESAKTQFNNRIEQTESFTDRQNKLNLEHRLDQLDNDRSEESETLTINDPFSKLLARSRSQLLSRYKDSEISQLDKAELYLLRNAIFGSHGYPFYTAKLAKYVARMGWSQFTPQFKPELVSPVERCNAFFLQQLHPNQELGALGRGVLIKDPNPDTANFLKPAICTCLAQPKMHVDCQRNSRGSNRTDFRELVDLILEIEQGPRNKIEWTFLDERDVTAADIDIFKNHEEKFYSAALDFNVAVQSALEAANQSLTEIGEAKRGPHWGVRLVFSPDTQLAMARSPVFAHKLAEGICGTVHHSLEGAGPFIPRMVSPIPFRPDPNSPVTEIYDKPIAFNDLRIKLTKDYIKKHYGVSLPEIEFVPSMLIVHISNTKDLQQYFESVREPTLPAKQRDDASTGAVEVNVSTHYVVDRDGAIFSFMKDFHIARHSVGLDRHAIGITAIGNSELPLTDEQAAATALLVRYLKGKYTTAAWLVSDAEASSFQRTDLWEETSPLKKGPEADPGKIFMEKLRHYLSDLQLSSLP